jgi:hypothetical protein
MARWRRAVELAMTGEEVETLTALSRSRTEPASRVSRAAMLLAYREQASFLAGLGARRGTTCEVRTYLRAKSSAARTSTNRQDRDTLTWQASAFAVVQQFVIGIGCPATQIQPSVQPANLSM